MSTPEQLAFKAACSRLFTKTSLALLPAAAALSLASAAHAQTVTWDGSASDNWNTPGNWDANAVPGAGDDIVIDADPGAFINGGTFAGANLTIGDEEYSVLNIIGASLSISGDVLLGDESFASLYIEDGGVLNATNLIAGGSNFGFGDIEIFGAGSQLNASTLVIGAAGGGSGHLEVYDGAHVDVDTLTFGVDYNSFARGDFRDAGTIVSATNLVQIGIDSRGIYGGAQVSVSDGAHFVAPAGIELAHSPNSLGILVIGGDDPGVIDTPTINMGDGYPQIVFFHDADHYVFTPDIEGAGANGYIWAASGETILTGQSSDFEGTVYIYNGARLIVNGELGGNYNVQTFLGGSGTVGNLHVYDFGMVSPGNSIGTLTADGDVTFEQESFLEIEANASGASDLLIVDGDATLNGGQVRVLLESGNYAPSTTYRILEADSVSGTFDGVDEDFAFFDAALDHGADYVDLTITRNATSFAELALTQNQRNLAGALDAMGPGDPISGAVTFLSTEDAQRAYATMAVDLYPGVANLSAQDFLSFANIITTRLQHTAQAPRPYQLASVGEAVAPRGTGGPSFWVQGLGAWGEIHSDSNYAELNTQRAGFALGADRAFGAERWAGFAFGYTQTDFDTDSIDAESESASYHAAIYGGALRGDYRLRGGLAYAYRDIDTDRVVEIGATTQQLSADYESQGVQIFGEIARGLELHSASVEPFLSAALIQQWTDGFTESGGSAALTMSDSDQTILALSAGARGAIELDDGSTLSASFAWRHAEGDIDEAANATLASAPDESFALNGAPLLADAALIEADYRVRIGEGILGFGYVGELGDGASQHSASLSYRLPL